MRERPSQFDRAASPASRDTNSPFAQSRSPLNRATPDAASRMNPQRSRPGDYGSRSMGDRQWQSNNGNGSGNRPSWNDGNRRNNGNQWYNDNQWNNDGRYGRYDDRYRSRYNDHYGHYHHYPYYNRYGCYQPYYRPYYSSCYPYFWPTFSFGFGFGWGSTPYYDYPYYYPYYAAPTVVYTQPVYDGTTYYTEPSTTYYGDSGAYVAPQPYVAPPQGSSTYIERQYESPGTTTTPAPQAPSQPPAQPQASAKQPDQRVLKAVGEGNEHFAAGRYEEARRSYGEAMVIDGTDGVPKLLFGVSRFAESDFSGAASVVRDALDATPDLIWYPFNIKALYREQSRFDEHVAGLARHVDANPADQQAQFLLGYMWYASGDAQNAKILFGTLSTNNSSDELYMALRDASAKAMESLTKQPQTQVPPPTR